MYAWLRSRLPRAAADALIVAWYVVLMALVFFYAMEPPAAFRYGNI